MQLSILLLYLLEKKGTGTMCLFHTCHQMEYTLKDISLLTKYLIFYHNILQMYTIKTKKLFYSSVSLPLQGGVLLPSPLADLGSTASVWLVALPDAGLDQLVGSHRSPTSAK